MMYGIWRAPLPLVPVSGELLGALRIHERGRRAGVWLRLRAPLLGRLQKTGGHLVGALG